MVMMASPAEATSCSSELLGGGDLAVEPRVAQRDGQVLGEHLQQLALARIDGPPRRAVVDDQLAQRPLGVADDAGHQRGRAAPGSTGGASGAMVIES